ncbi:MAG: LysM peptidoglycan-binding domain-containing protein [Deltaproteobacteria bacterium]|nr:LysM peptidoglycan-binding domain-containing protein [Deltaproteobacteria bacterium]
MTSPAMAQGPAVTQSYVVEKGDTARSIAQKFYGKASLGPSLWRANQNLVAHPKQLTAGDTIYIFPESTLTLKKAVEMPPEPESPIVNLYDRGQLLERSYPKSFSFITDFNSGIPVRLRVRLKVPSSDGPREVDQYFEIRVVGEVIGSADLATTFADHGELINTRPGRTLLSTSDVVNIRFTEDISKILDSDTFGDDDPYFRSFPVYAVAQDVDSIDKTSRDYGKNIGALFLYKGNIKVFTRAEGVRPLVQKNARNRTGRKVLEGNLDPVTYSAEVTYVESPILFNDKVLLFVPIDPGPERRLDPPYVEEPGSYVSPGH